MTKKVNFTPNKKGYPEKDFAKQKIFWEEEEQLQNLALCFYQSADIAY